MTPTRPRFAAGRRMAPLLLLGAAGRRMAPLLLLGAALSVGCGDDDPSMALPHCDRATLVEALAAARPGDVVRIGGCVVDGPLVVGPGVRLEGLDATSTIRGLTAGTPTVRLDAGEPATTLAGLRVEQAAPAYAVLASGRDGAVAIESVVIDSSLGAGLGIVEVDRASVTNVELTGPIGAANVLALPLEPSWDQTATFGVVIDASGSSSSPIELSELRVSGFAEVGVYTRGAFVRWRGGASRGNRSVGVLATEGELDLTGLELSATLSGRRPLSFGGVFRDCTVISSGLRVSDGESLGLLHDGATAMHGDLEANDNRDAGLWFQRGSTAEVFDARLARNAVAGIVSVASAALSVRSSTIESSREVPSLDDLFGAIEVGDGVHVVGGALALTLDDLDLRNNERVGLLIELDGAALATPTIRDVRVEATGAARGAVLQGGAVPAGWDAQITRSGDTAANDAMPGTPLDFLSVRDNGLPPAYPTPCD